MTWNEISVQDFDLDSCEQLIDVREVSEYLEGHIPGAINVPLSSLEDSIKQIPKSGTVHVVCRSGARSASACDWLTQQSVLLSVSFINVGGGTIGWIIEGGEVVTGERPN